MISGLFGEKGRADELQAKVRRAIPIMSGIDKSPELLTKGLQLLASAPYTGPGKRAAAGHHLLKEALRLQGHPITNKVKRPFREARESQSHLVRRSLESMGWLKI